MITEAKDFLRLITIDKDVQLGKFIPDYSYGLLQDTLNNKIETTIENEKCTELFNAITDILEKTDTLNKTNIEVHFTVRAASMQQYVSPYTKDYNIGNTHKFIHESVIWAYRPEHIHVGRMYENTFNKKAGGLKEEQKYNFGSVDDYWNIVALHTHEVTKSKKEDSEFSTIHIAVFIPVGDQLFAEISALHREKVKQQRNMKEIRKKSGYAATLKKNLNKLKNKKNKTIK
jgi:hypothetical protein